MQGLLNPSRLYTAREVLSMAPGMPGVYAFYFDEPPPGIDPAGCHRYDGRWLLYVGKATRLRRRLGNDLVRNAAVSTLRLSLGCLLSDKLGLQLQRLPTGKRNFAAGEKQITDWIAKHTLVAWVATEHAAKLERAIITSAICLPLNIEDNPCAATTTVCKAARDRARWAADSVQGQRSIKGVVATRSILRSIWTLIASLLTGPSHG
jgi:hypothetical protein